MNAVSGWFEAANRSESVLGASGGMLLAHGAGACVVSGEYGSGVGAGSVAPVALNGVLFDGVGVVMIAAPKAAATEDSSSGVAAELGAEFLWINPVSIGIHT